MSRFVSFAVLIGVIAVVGFLFYRVMASFFLPLFAAAVLVVIFHPIYRWMLVKTRRKQLAAALTTASIVLIVLVPIALVVALAAVEGASVIHWDQQAVIAKKNELLQRYNLDIPLGRELCDDLVAMAGELDDVDRTAIKSDENVDQRPVDRMLKDAERSSSPEDVEKLVARVKESNVLLKERATKAAAMLKEQREGLQTATDKTARDKREIAELDSRIKRLAALNKKWEVFHEQVVAIKPDTATTQLNVDDAVALASARRAFDDFKADYVGSALMMWVRDTANPTEARVKTWMQSGKKFLQQWLLTIGGATPGVAGGAIIGLVVTIVAVYFFLADGSTMVKTAMKLSPLDDNYEEELIQEFDQISRAVVVATLLSAVAQGILAGIGFYFAGIESVFLLTLLTAVLAMIPFVGATAVWLPTALWLYFFEDQTIAAIGLGVYGFAIVSQADNVIKPWVLHGQSRLHPLLALLSVLGGVQALGPIGILVGPMIVAFAQALMNILHRELSTFDQRHEPDQRGTKRKRRNAIVIPVEGFSTITLSGQSLRR